MTTGSRRGISRRESLRRVGWLAMAAGTSFSFVACSEQTDTILSPWPALELPPVNAPGYGTDPDLVHPAPAPWPKTLSDEQLQLVTVLVDILIPADGASPAASAVGVVEVIDEWISAPYPVHEAHRNLLLSGFSWCDQESRRRFGLSFVEADEEARLAIIDEIAGPAVEPPDDLAAAREFFDGLRRLVAGAYYTSAEGMRELGYEGNVPLAGDYPGPTDAAMAHLTGITRALNLELPAAYS